MPPPSARRRVLIVSPNFPPINAPDMQRARQALPFLRDHGWEPVVLAVTPESSGTGVFEPLLEQTYPSDIRIVRVQGLLPQKTRRFGLGSLWWRCGRALREAGDRLLAENKFDLVFFTTTQFDSFTLGRRWKERHGVPYVLDYQDPWINPYYRQTGTRPPGGWLKFGFTQWLAGRREPAVVRQAAAIIAVSEAYAANLANSYLAGDRRRISLLPFGVAEADFTVAARHRPATPLIDFADGNFHHVYTGRAGPDMEFALRVLFRAYDRFRKTDPQRAGRMRFHFIGTDYSPPPFGRDWAKPIAEEEGVAGQVHEHRARVPYFDALHYLLHAQALMVVGSSDASYTASKLFPYLLARRPTLLLFHSRSAVLEFAQRIGAGERFAFTDVTNADQLAAEIHDRWFVGGGHALQPTFQPEALQPYAAQTLTAQLAAVFDTASLSLPS
jgi:hypothetical protein